MKLSLFPFLLLCLWICFSCSPYPREVRNALELAHSNASELENVLEHYRAKDAQKYEAACFLIANMPYHGSRREITLSNLYDSYFATTDSLFQLYFGEMSATQIKKKIFKIPDSVRNMLATRYAGIPRPAYTEGKKDIECITSDFLIDNIESAFDVWRHSPLLQYMTFEEFKESVLPYRTTDEPLLYRRSELKEKFYPIISREDMTDIRIPIERYKMYILKQQRISYYTKRRENIGIYDLFLPSTIRNCHSQVTWTSNIFRACGIPVCYEFTPQWPDRENRHFWNASPDSSGIYIPYSTPANNLGEDWDNHLKLAGKVYRKTFAVHKDTPYFQRAAEEEIPEILSSPTLQDETFRYHQTVTLELPFHIRTENRMAYLSFVTRSGLTPVAWGKIDKTRHKAVFHQVPLSMTFILSYYEDDCLKAVGEPFRLTASGKLDEIPQPLTTLKYKATVMLSWTGRKLMRLPHRTVEREIAYQEFKIDSTKHVDMRLLRKYPLKSQLLKLHENLKGACVLASSSLQGPQDTIAVLSETPCPNWQTINIGAQRSYRYLSIHSRNRQPLHLGEIQLYGFSKGTVAISSPYTLPLDVHADTLYRNVIDGNVETFVNTPTVHLRLKDPACIKEIRFIPRNANNAVNEGDTYALYYFCKGEWMMFELQKAENNFVDFHNVPACGLYLLKDINSGKEELPFTYSKQGQHWIFDASPIH